MRINLTLVPTLGMCDSAHLYVLHVEITQLPLLDNITSVLIKDVVPLAILVCAMPSTDPGTQQLLKKHMGDKN